MGKSNYLIIVILFVIVSCSDRVRLNADEYFRYVANPENNLCVEKKFNEFTYQLRVKTPEEMAYIETLPAQGEGFDSLVKVYSNTNYFEFKIATKSRKKQDPTKYKVNDFNEFQERFDKLAFRLQENFYLVDEAQKDTIKPLSYHFERSYNLSDKATFNLSFKKIPEVGKSFNLVFEDDVFDNGPIIFKINKESIKNAPILKL